MRSVAAYACVILACSVGSAASAGVIGQNGPVNPIVDGSGRMIQDGSFSDALSSGGTYFYSQAIGQTFDVDAAGAGTFQSLALRFWGTSEYQSIVDPSGQSALSANIVGFQVSILRNDGTTRTFPTVASWSLQRGSVTQTRTGTYVDTGTQYLPNFQLDVALPGTLSLAAGRYVISIGAILNASQGDAFAWMDGQANGALPATQCWATVGDVASDWGIWSEVPDGTSGAFSLGGDVVPAPGALALLGLAARNGRRRRAD